MRNIMCTFVLRIMHNTKPYTYFPLNTSPFLDKPIKNAYEQIRQIFLICHVYKGMGADAIWQRNANFQFSMTFNFNFFSMFLNIRNHLMQF
jgi:hypothetical protein